MKIVRCDEKEKIRKLTANSLYAGFQLFSNNLLGIRRRKEKLVLNKPVHVGMTILDNSKNLMYDFYYNKLKRQYGEKCKLIYTDTDSLLLNIQTDDVYKDMEENKDMYDTSHYSKDHFLRSKKNKKVLGKMKDEMNGKPISACVCLGPKMYSIMTEEKNIKKAKGVKKRVVKKRNKA